MNIPQDKRHIRKETPPKATIMQLAQALPLEASLTAKAYVALLLLQRGIDSAAQANDFFNPSLSQLHSPFLFKNMHLATERIQQAVAQNEKILLYGDYDVDGTTAVSLLRLFFKANQINTHYYIPDRFEEGYGVSEKGMAFALENQFTLVITLDCGIRAVELISQYSQLGINFIVCDHHEPGPQVPPAIAVLDAKQTDCPYPYKELSGCGVAFKLAQALCQTMQWDIKTAYNLLDLLAVSIAADIVPITGENRILTHWGLKKLNQKPTLGLHTLCEVAQLNHPETNLPNQLNVGKVVFGIAPRINAIGRLLHARAAVDLLCTTDPNQAQQLAQGLDTENQNRRTLDQNITKQALAMIADDPNGATKATTVLYHPEWHKGVVGIVASRCIEHHYRPTIILTQSNGELTGSARSVMGFDLLKAITACQKHLTRFGGHKHAAGLSLKPENLTDFATEFEAYAAQQLTPDDQKPPVFIDTEVNFDHINFELYHALQKLKPFGPGNMQPTLLARSLSPLPNSLRLLGDSNAPQQHIKFSLLHQQTNSIIEVIGFGLGTKFDLIEAAEKIDLVFVLKINEFRGIKTLQLEAKDITPSK